MRLLDHFLVLSGATALLAASTQTSRPAERREEDISRIFATNCMPCHGSTNPAGGLDLSGSTDQIAATASVKKGYPEQSKLFEDVSGDHRLMPRGRDPLNDEDVRSLRAWIASLKPDPSPIFLARCMPCHSSDNRRGGLDLSQGLDSLATSADVVKGSPERSVLLKRIRGTEGRQMPPNGAPLSDAEIATVSTWITSTKPDPTAIFAARCSPCHSSSRKAGGLDLSQGLDGIAASTDVKPGDPSSSILFQRLHESGGSAMPKGRAPLSDAEIQVIQSWISGLPAAQS